MKYSKLLILIFSISTFSACKKLDNLLVNPNSVDPSLANVDLLLNQVQLSYRSFYSAASNYGAQLTRQQEMFGPLYNNAYSPTSFDGIWTDAYTGVLKNADALIPIAIDQKKFVQAGIAQVLKAYTLGTLVDDFGDIPNSEAVLGKENLNPAADPGAEVYNTVITLLDSAINNFTKSGAAAGPSNDLFFKGTKSNWIKTAKTLKLKFYMQERLVDNTVNAKIQALLTENDLINDVAQDFTFKYGTQNTSPDSRHPRYAANYNNASAGSNSVGDYLSNYFMWAVAVEKGGTGGVTNIDPRRRYYFYRQRTNYADVNSSTCPCADQPKPGHYSEDMPFCLVGSGYWGRDHGDNSGAPPDGPYLTTWGVYPAAGEFDDNQASSVDYNRGGKGAGIDPIWLSSYTYFLQAEAAVALNLTTNGDARSLLEKGIRASISKVINFPATVAVTVPAARVPTQAAIDAYVAVVLANYDAATSNAERLDVIIKEYYLAAWGNGVEPYNNYRRTGSPGNLQPVKSNPNPGFFLRSLTYPSVYVNRNTNAAPQKNPGAEANKVFWDNNPDNFIH
jgi:hypothetical protein